MGKGKLLYALDSQKGKNYKLIKQKKQQKEAAKRKKAKASIAGSEEGKNVKAQGNGALAVPDDSSNAWESDKSIDTHVVSVRGAIVGAIPFRSLTRCAGRHLKSVRWRQRQ